MNGPLELMTNRYGGMKRWEEVKLVSADFKTAGAIWQIKGQVGTLRDMRFAMELHQEKIIFYPFLHADQIGSFEAHRVAIENLDGKIVNESFNPRQLFKGHSTDTKWDHLEVIYFLGCLFWTSFSAPFSLNDPDSKIEELASWNEVDETWRCLEVTYSKNIATHSQKQIFYFNSEGLIKRHDYDLEISSSISVSQYYYDHTEFDGIIIPKKTEILVRSSDGDVLLSPIVAVIELDKLKFI